MADDSFSEFLRVTESARKRSPADVIAADELSGMPDDSFDDALWLAFCGLIHTAEDLGRLPAGARMYYSTRSVEWEAGSGGFDAALDYAGEFLEEALAGYQLIGDLESVDLWRRVIAAADDDQRLEELMDEVQGPPWQGVPWDDAARVSYIRAHRDEFRIQ